MRYMDQILLAYLTASFFPRLNEQEQGQFVMFRKNLHLLTLVAVILFVFLAPVVPTSVTRFWLLPWWNQCTGIASPSEPQYQSTLVFASVSYIGFQMLFAATIRVDHGDFGLVFVPNDGWYTVQLPPLGFGEKGCL